MNEKLDYIKTALTDRLYNALQDTSKITSTEQIYNCTKAFEILNSKSVDYNALVDTLIAVKEEIKPIIVEKSVSDSI